jgi:hypothetical protein
MTPALQSPVYFAIVQALADAVARSQTGEQVADALDAIDRDIDVALKERHRRRWEQYVAVTTE